MSGNLVDPLRNIAEGELGALGFSFGLCFVFMLLLGASVDRNALQCDAMISEKLSLTKLVFLGGLYISCLSAILSSTLGTSRVVQGIANEGLFPQMSKLLIEESSPTRESHRATVLVTAFAIILLLLGDLNQIAILSSLPFLFTYATVNYAYVSLSMSDDLEVLNNECAAENDNKQQTSYGTVQDGAAIYSSHGQQRKSLDALFAQTTEGINSLRQENVQKAWYQHCINRYVSFGAAIIHILVATFVHRWFALLHFIAFAALYFYLGGTCSAPSDQGVSRFSIMHMIRVAMSTQDTPDLNSSQNSARLVAPPPSALFQPGNIQPPQALNAQNPDYAERKNYHHTEQLGAAKQHP
uniref:Amino acid permease/ SLC12A domain-containing protein n=1 Tax=Meloidogyne incognita TaxID=6306 RepID=A0A914M420_MELIC